LTPEAADHVEKARHCLSRARVILASNVPEVAAREAYLAAFHAAQALIAERTGKDAKTHRGVHVQFARLTRDETTIDDGLRQFLPQAYDMKAIADYGVGPNDDVSNAQAAVAIENAERFVAAIVKLLT
jgi:uncharacterized protein (UPF0332 family)